LAGFAESYPQPVSSAPLIEPDVRLAFHFQHPEAVEYLGVTEARRS
jgi:hypothetical protein